MPTKPLTMPDLPTLRTARLMSAIRGALWRNPAGLAAVSLRWTVNCRREYTDREYRAALVAMRTAGLIACKRGIYTEVRI